MTMGCALPRIGAWAAAPLCVLALVAATPAAFAIEPNCRAIESTSARLSCYDAAFPPKAPKATGLEPTSPYKDPYLAEEARTTAKLKSICRGC